MKVETFSRLRPHPLFTKKNVSQSNVIIFVCSEIAQTVAQPLAFFSNLDKIYSLKHYRRHASFSRVVSSVKHHLFCNGLY